MPPLGCGTVSKPTAQADNPWVSKHLFDTLQSRCADAEACLRAVLMVIDPDILTRHAGNWKAAADEVTGTTI